MQLENKALNKPFNVVGLDLSEFETLARTLGEKAYKGRQIFKWFYKQGISDFLKMSDLSKSLRQRLQKEACFQRLSLITTVQSPPPDGTTKYLFRLSDGERIESVLIRAVEALPRTPARFPQANAKITLCLSSQVGCPLACRFCATGDIGFKRDLTSGEIIDQALLLREELNGTRINNIVFMGMGEPLLNYEAVVKAIRIMTSELGMELPARKITVSTAGWVPGIYRLAEEKLKVKLAISLNAPDQEQRLRLMPIAHKYPLPELLKAAKHFAHRTKRRVTIEYILMQGLNDASADALQLAKIVRSIPCKINLILYNPNPGQPIQRPTIESVQHFRNILYPRCPAVTLRISKGWQIQAACGQLAAGYPLRNKPAGMTINHQYDRPPA